MRTQENLIRLLGTLDNIAAERGFTFVCSELMEAPRAVREYPAMWMEQPKFISQQGEKHGRQRYRSRHALITREHQPSPTEKMAKRIFLEDTLLEIHEALSQEELVALIDSVKSEALAICNADEVSASVTAEIEMIF